MPWRARPVPFWRYGFLPPPRISPRVLVSLVPVRRAASWAVTTWWSTAVLTGAAKSSSLSSTLPTVLPVRSYRGIDGFEDCRRLRRREVWSPVVMLTARDAVEDRVKGLDAGADDYLTKPFSFAELHARLRALGRRGPVERPPVLEAGTLRLDPSTRRVWRGDDEISLSTKEFALLETFMRRPGQVLSRFDLLEHAWDYSYENRSNIVDVYVRYLREKIDRPFGESSLVTVRGAGYRLRQ